MGRQNSKKIAVDTNDAGAEGAADSPGTNHARKRYGCYFCCKYWAVRNVSPRIFALKLLHFLSVWLFRPDSIMVTKERSKGKALNEGPAGDSVKLQRERSKAALKVERSTIKE